MLRESPHHVDLLVLGAGWTSTFLIPLLQSHKISYAATSTTGRDATIPFKFEPESADSTPYARLPAAQTVLVTFPLTGHGQSKSLISLYRSVHGTQNSWIQLGVTSIFKESDWSTEESPHDSSDARGIAEDEFIGLGGTVLDLCGLYGGTRVPSQWLGRLAKSKEDVKKRGAVHFVHGEDVARAIVAVYKRGVEARRWLVTDLRVYDWWDLILSFAGEQEGASEEDGKIREQFAGWVGELMLEEDVRALPREMSLLGRKLDGRAFWKHHGLWPRHARLN